MTKLLLFSIVIVWIIVFDLTFAYMEIDLQHVAQLNELTYVDFSKVFIRKVKKERKVFGNATVHVSLDNNDTAEINFYVKQAGEYRLMPYKLPRKGFCEFLQGDKYFYPELTEQSNFPLPPPCPFPAGVYTYYGYAPSLKNFPLPMLQTGDYAVEWTVYRGSLLLWKNRSYGGLINI